MNEFDVTMLEDDGSFTPTMTETLNVTQSTNFNDLTNRPSYAGTTMTGSTNIPTVPTKTSQLTNDSGFITSVDWTAILNKPATFTPSAHTHVKADITDFPTIPEKTSQLTNDSGFLTEHQSLSGYATESWVEGKGYLQEHQSLSAYRTSANQDDIDNAIKGRLDTIEGKESAWDAKADISDIPTALSELTDDSTHRLVTDTEKTTWSGKYTKPSDGIPKSDLASAVQTSLGKADTALQSHQSLSAYRTATAQDAIDSNKADLVNGLVPANQLPSYVDDVLEYATRSDFPSAGESGKIYIAQDTNKTYRWAGSDYSVISDSIALGETSSTAYRGDRGAAAYAHISTTNNPHSVTKAQVGLGNVDNTNDANKPISTATQTALDLKADEADLTDHTGNSDIHVTTANKTAWSNKYDKPSGGIPKTDLASAVQTSLDKADSALQSHQTKADLGLGNVDNTSDATKKTNFTGSIASGNTGFVTGGAVYGHTSDTTIHITSAERTKWNAYETTISGKQDTISDLSTIRSNASAVSGKEAKGKVTISSTEYTVGSVDLVVTFSDETSSTYHLLTRS